MALVVFCNLLWLFNSFVNTHSLSFTVGYTNLPKGLYGSFFAVNTQNEVIIIGGCDDYDASSSEACRPEHTSSNIYVWDTTLPNPSFEEVSSSTPGVNVAWNPSNGYPFPIYQDIMYIPWYNVMYKYDTINKQWLENTTSISPKSLYYPCTVYDEIENKIYLLGGVNWSGQGISGSVQIYDINTNSWESFLNVEPMPFDVYGGSCVLAEIMQVMLSKLF